MITVGNRKSMIKFLNFNSCVLIIMWYILPWFRGTVNVYLLFAISIVWLSTLDLKCFVSSWTRDTFYFILTLILFLPFIVSGSFRFGQVPPRTAFILFTLFFLPIFIYNYYIVSKKDYMTVKKLLQITLVVYFIGVIQTLIGFQQFPLASRELAGSISKSPELLEIYTRMGIGGFGFIYASVFLSLALFYFLMHLAKNFKIGILEGVFLLILLISSCFMIIQSSYTVAILMLFCGMFVIIIMSNRIGLLLPMIAILVIITIPNYIIGGAFVELSRVFENNSILNERLSDFGNFILLNSTDSMTNNRLNLYRISLSSFLANPIFGRYGPLGNMSSPIGGHSGWLDLAAMYGIYITVPVALVFLSNFRKKIIVQKSSYRHFLKLCYIWFVFFGFINTIFTNIEIGFVLFFVIPSIPYISSSYLNFIQAN